jgi:hypothetical protein
MNDDTKDDAPETPREALEAEPPKLIALDEQFGETLTVEAWAEKHETPNWLFQATRVGLQWARGQEMTEAQFLKGIEWAANAPCR